MVNDYFRIFAASIASTMSYNDIREEELKNKVAKDWFGDFDTSRIIGNIDFSVFPNKDDIFHNIPLLWAEAKTGNYDTVTMFVQLILTIGKARTFTRMLPPAFLGAFDYQKFAFVPYNAIEDIFSINDFNWKVTPSNHESKEFLLVKERIESILAENTFVFSYEKDAEALRFFISHNIAKATDKARQTINKNNFLPIYLRWLEVIKPIISVDWDRLKREFNILDCDFYLADLFVDDKDTDDIADDTAIYANLFVQFENQGYKIPRENTGLIFDSIVSIKQKDVYKNFWKLYKRPPHSAYHDYIIERRELLVPQDIRERKGAFFTPRQWVSLSQQYLADYLGEDWQEEYHVWDCAAGTGNLLTGLTNKYNLWASTLDQADVNVMQERIAHGAMLLNSHIFQFDFLNDEFIPQSKGGKLPEGLYDIISNEEKRKKLVIYINPPYAEATTARTIRGTGENKAGTAIGNRTNEKYKNLIKKAANELFAQFLIRIYKEIPGCKIGNFSKLKNLQSYNFIDFRAEYLAKLEKVFLVPANTFDNVTGQFAISFQVWDGAKKVAFKEIEAAVYDRKGEFVGHKKIKRGSLNTINKWIGTFEDKKAKEIAGYIVSCAPDFQHNNQLAILSKPQKRYCLNITNNNLIQFAIYFAVRHCIAATWLNDRDQFLFPKEDWLYDREFQTDCLAFTLFHSQNRITAQEGINHWIPFAEQEVDAPDNFSSHFMTDYIAGKVSPSPLSHPDLFRVCEPTEAYHRSPIVFSAEAQAVFAAGRALWRYYLAQPKVNVNGSLYDIRLHFQGKNAQEKMNSKSEDTQYNLLIDTLRKAMEVLARKLEEGVYAYGFLE